MADKIIPRYPIYIPSKGRADKCLTAKNFISEGVEFKLVVTPNQYKSYLDEFSPDLILTLPSNSGGLIAARNWIKAHSIKAGAKRHWQFDDNIYRLLRRWRDGRRVPCDANSTLAACEDFVDRYKNIAIAGLAYAMFMPSASKMPPFSLNKHVYSATLVLNDIPHRWRIIYNDDTDICLQVLADGWCTVLFNAFMIHKVATMQMTGGNTTDLYQGDGRLRMAKELERLWPGVVETKRRHGRPQHTITANWRKFDNELQLIDDLDLNSLAPNEYGMKLTEVKPIKNKQLKQAFDKSQQPTED